MTCDTHLLDTIDFQLNGIDACDGIVPLWGVPPYRQIPIFLTDQEYGGQLQTVLPGYFEQSAHIPDNRLCPYFEGLPNAMLTPEEKYVACKTSPRAPAKHIDLDLLDFVGEKIRNHDYEKGSWFQMFATASMHTPLSYPKEFNEVDADELPDYFQDDMVKPVPTNDDLRLGTARNVRFVDDVFGRTMQAIKDAGQWDNTIVYFTTDNGGAMYGAVVQNNYPLRSSKMSIFEGTNGHMPFAFF